MSLKKNTILFTCLILLLLIVIGCNSRIDNADSKNDKEENNKDTITLKLSSHAPDTALVAKGIQEFMERVTELTDGQIQFEYYPNQQLGDGADSIDMVKNGVTDLAHIITNFHPNELRTANAFGSPFGLFEDSVSGSKAFNKVTQQNPMLEEDFLKHGVRPISMFFTSPNGIFTDGKEVKVPADLNGFKIRGTGGPILNSLKDIGATPTQLTSNEVYNAFKNGVINGVVTHAAGAMDYGWEEIIKYAIKGINFGTTPIGVIINEDVYQGLPENAQEAIIQAGEEAAENIPKIIYENNVEAYEKMEEFGITVHELTEDEQEDWQKIYEKTIKKMKEEMNSEEFDKSLELFIDELNN